MTSETLNLWGKGAVTLPKAWRDQWETKLFLAEVNEMGYLVIKPILTDDVVYYEDNEGVGLRFPHGMPMETFIKRFEEANAKITAEEKAAKKRRKRRSGK